MTKNTVLKAFFPLLVLWAGIANAQTPNSVPLSPAQIQAATNTAIAPAVPGGITASVLNGIINQFDPFTNLWFDVSNAQNGLLNYWNGTAWAPLVLEEGNGGVGASTAAANNFFAGPASGIAAIPEFRPIAPADLVASLLTPSPIGATTPNTGAFTSLSATSAAVSGPLSMSGTLSGAGITALFAAPPPIGGTTPTSIVATTLVAAPPSGLGQALNITQNFTGSSSNPNGVAADLINIASDNTACNGAPSAVYCDGLVVQNLFFGGPAASGGRLNFFSYLRQTSPTAPGNLLPDYVADYANVTTTSGDGGGAGSERGSYFGRWTVASLGPLATHVSALQGQEVDLTAPAGSSTLHKSGLLIGGANSDVVHGSLNDNLIWLASDATSTGQNYGIQLGRADIAAGIGVASTGTIMGSKQAATVANIFDFHLLTVTGGFAWLGPGSTSSIDGAGNLTAHSLTAVSLVATNTAPTIASGFCTSPAILSNNGTYGFQIQIGTSCAGSVGVVTMPAAVHGWICKAENESATANNAVAQTSYTTTSITLTNFSRTTGFAANWSAADVIEVMCTGL
jgi:hypothetical protein